MTRNQTLKKGLWLGRHSSVHSCSGLHLAVLRNAETILPKNAQGYDCAERKLREGHNGKLLRRKWGAESAYNALELELRR